MKVNKIEHIVMIEVLRQYGALYNKYLIDITRNILSMLYPLEKYQKYKNDAYRKMVDALTRQGILKKEKAGKYVIVALNEDVTIEYPKEWDRTVRIIRYILRNMVI